MKVQLRYFILILILTVFVIGCSKDDNQTDDIQNFRTVSQDVAADFVKSRIKENYSRKLSDFDIEIYAEYIQYAHLSNSDEKLAILPVVTSSSNSYSRLMLLNIQDKVEAVLYNMYSKNDFSTETFFGDIFITDLEGNFINGYKMEDDYYIARYQLGANAGASTSRTGDSADCQTSDDGIECQELDEIWLTNKKKNIELGNLYTSIVPDDEGNVNEITDVDSGNGGGGGSSSGGGINAHACPAGMIKDLQGSCVDPNSEEDCPLDVIKDSPVDCSFFDQEVWDEQNPYDDWNRLTQCEKDFFAHNPVTLPFAVKNRPKAEAASQNRFGDCINADGGHAMHNTIGDAYRHSYFSALNANDMGYAYAKLLGDAHECETPENELDQKQMDLNNNKWGFSYANSVFDIDEEQFYQSFMQAFKEGKIEIISECIE